MSRLEEIKGRLDHIRGILGLVGDQETVNMAATLEELIIQQSERVEVLERDRDALEEKYDECRKDAVILHKENNRYKQALQVIRLNNGDPYIERVVKGALESDKT